MSGSGYRVDVRSWREAKQTACELLTLNGPFALKTRTSAVEEEADLISVAMTSTVWDTLAATRAMFSPAERAAAEKDFGAKR